MINREDMLELSRRMTPARNHLVRIAGAYFDDEGYLEGTFNTHFQKLKGKEKEHCLEIAKTIPFAETNQQLVDFKIPGMKPGSIWQLFYALIDCEFKNDAMLMSLYDMVADSYQAVGPYAVYVYYGAYDVPVKGSDKERQGESEEVYRYLILAVCPVDRDQNPQMPNAGLLYPAFNSRSSDISRVNVYGMNKGDIRDILNIIKIDQMKIDLL